MATLPQYRLNWPVGETKMMLISVGTGSAAAVSRDLNASGQLAPANVAHLPGVLMGGAAIDQDINCRAIGRCVFGELIDSEIGDMIPRQGDPLKGDVVPLEEDCRRQFLYARYNPDVSRSGLDALGLNKIDPDHVQALDQIEYINEMQSVGRVYAAKFVNMMPFQRFVVKD
jgi:uncharacterized protein